MIDLHMTEREASEKATSLWCSSNREETSMSITIVNNDPASNRFATMSGPIGLGSSSQ